MEQAIFTGDHAGEQLASLGLEEEELRHALYWAYNYNAVNVNANEPPNALGMTMYFKATRALRERLMPRGWRRDNSRNLAMTIAPKGALAIMIAAGDENTGRKEGNPYTISRKGPAARDAIEKGEQLVMELDDITWVTPASGPGIWVLLHHIDLETEELRCELSRPFNFDANTCIAKWQERIILRAISFPAGKELEEDMTDEIEIEIHPYGA